ncbi:MAG: 2Fe-2S iron-sulfur cluster binding domain-containing protein [Deferribacteraceae bacterium]|jgi:ferredoxin|nr:2Fe-2S iron-sulfur cluster binding domain-containing protein [Deferribacteraceae bacterium]
MFGFNKKIVIRIKNQDKRIEVQSGANLYSSLVAENLIPPTLCGGNGLCSQCKVHISQKNLAKPNGQERKVLAKMNLDAGFRLACQTSVKSDMVVDISELSAQPLTEEIHIKPLQKPLNPITVTADDKEAELPKKPVIKPHVATFTPLDGLLLNFSSGRVKYHVYSASVDGVTQEGLADNPFELLTAIESGTLSDYIYEVLKIKDIDRVLVFMDSPSDMGEPLFDLVSYSSFETGSMPCEIIHPLPDTDINLFFRFLSTRDKKRIFIPLDRLDRVYYFRDSIVTRIPFRLGKNLRDLFNAASDGKNPVSHVSDDLRTVKATLEHYPPDTILLAELMKAAANMLRLKLVDNELNLYPRNALEPSVPLEYVVKLTQSEGKPAYSLFRDKQATLYITQEQLTNLALVRKFIRSAIEFAEASLGNLESVIISTPHQVNDLLKGILSFGVIPKHLEKVTAHMASISVASAAKLFLEQNVKTYMIKYYGSYQSSD